MFNKLKEVTGLAWTELTTVIIVLGVGFPFLTKLGFYNRLGVNWYKNTGNAFSIFLSSISIIFWVLLGFAFGYIVYHCINIIKQQITRYYVVLGIIIIAIILIGTPLFLNSLKFMNLVVNYNYLGFLISLVAFIILLVVLFINADLRDLPISNFQKKNLIPTFAIIIILITGFFSWMYGGAEADKVWKYRNLILNSVILSDSKEKWYLVDYANDKALILKEGNGLIFKIVEYKDIKQIMPPQQEMEKFPFLFK